jgi:hypothetical protein
VITVISSLKKNDKTYSQLKCEVCGNIFDRLKCWVDHKIKYSNIKTICCSKKCTDIFKIKKVDVKCFWCEKIYKKPPSQVKRGKYSFCSASCRTKYYNINKTWGCTRSKLERFLENKIQQDFSNLVVNCNDRIAIGSELDFYFPQLASAIQINGITHYKPIYGKDKFNKVKKLDKEKTRLCKEKNIKLLIINCCKDKKNDKLANEKHWKNIRKFIENCAATIS